MTDQQDRERESRLTDETNFEERVDEEAAERDRLAERLRDEPALEEQDDEAS